jgi:pyrimidine-specific ribonucleoside hydrolase
MALSWFDRAIPVGAFDIDYPKNCVSAWHYRTFGDAPPSRDAEHAPDLLLRLCDAQTTLVTGGPLKNLASAVGRDGFVLGRWVGQGGFAGEGVVPRELQLPQFRGRTHVPSYNLDGAREAARTVLAAQNIGEKRLVSKNVCHGVAYDLEVHEAVSAAAGRSLSLRLIARAMVDYLRRHKAGKKLHDPFAACCAIDPGIATWSEVELDRAPSGWGARLAPGSGTFIVTAYDRRRFLALLTMT